MRVGHAFWIGLALEAIALASPANSCFQFSKPAEVLPHWAALALPPVHASAASATAATVLICSLFNMLSPLINGLFTLPATKRRLGRKMPV